MSFKDRTYCASPQCTNECGRKLTEDQKRDVAMLSDAGYWSAQVSYAYFCGEDGTVICGGTRNE
jgi:hypothetical protein